MGSAVTGVSRIRLAQQGSVNSERAEGTNCVPAVVVL